MSVHPSDLNRKLKALKIPIKKRKAILIYVFGDEFPHLTWNISEHELRKMGLRG